MNIEFLSTPWFYVCVGVVAVLLKWFRNQDKKMHKRWYMPTALITSYVLAAVLVFIVEDYAWDTIFLHGSLIYVGQHLFGDQVLKRFEKDTKLNDDIAGILFPEDQEDA